MASSIKPSCWRTSARFQVALRQRSRPVPTAGSIEDRVLQIERGLWKSLSQARRHRADEDSLPAPWLSNMREAGQRLRPMRPCNLWFALMVHGLCKARVYSRNVLEISNANEIR